MLMLFMLMLITFICFKIAICYMFEYYYKFQII
jgi:hypothetical protein